MTYRWGNRELVLKNYRGRLRAATASPLLFDFVLPSCMGSSGIDLVGFESVGNAPAGKITASDFDSNWIMAKLGVLRKP